MPIERPPAPGEQNQQIGDDGARRAKKWLDATTRVRHSYTNMDDGGPGKLSFNWPNGGTSYSYDLGGVFRGKPFDNEVFVAESKKYTASSDQGTHFDKFLAQTYCTLDNHSRLAQHFMWITWAPFRVTTWSTIASSENIRKAIHLHADKVFSLNNDQPSNERTTEIDDLIDQEIIDYMTANIWMIVLSDKQEQLVISVNDRAELAKIWTERELLNAF